FRSPMAGRVRLEPDSTIGQRSAASGERRAESGKAESGHCYNPKLVKQPNKRGSDARPDGADAISELTTNRLSIYLRWLNALDAEGVRTVSSQGLAERFHLNAAQIRKDLAYFGAFGVRGVGYYVEELRRRLRQILGLDRRIGIAIIGAGNLGLALADYQG